LCTHFSAGVPLKSLVGVGFINGVQANNLLKNSLAVKKDATLFKKIASVKKVVKSKKVSKEWCDGIG